MKVCYLAHPISGDVHGNVQKVLRLVNHLLRSAPAVMPFAPYISSLMILDDSREEDRRLGIMSNLVWFEKRVIDELWICGDLSEGVQREIDWADDNGIHICDMREWADDVLSGRLVLANLTPKGFVESAVGRFPLRKSADQQAA